MRLMNEIPDVFWSLFRSKNRAIYIEALLIIHEEYQYSNYFLSREVCIQTLSHAFTQRKIEVEQDEMEDDLDLLEPPATRIMNWLLRAQWLRKVEDYANMATNIVIPDYAFLFIDVFEQLSNDDNDSTQVYIQNIYAILYSLRNDPRSSISLLNTALVNTRKLNKILQDMLHNMDKFFKGLLDQKQYGDLLKEHLDGYVGEIVNKKYHILKTSDNFYLYKNNIKAWLRDMREDTVWMEQVSVRAGKTMEESQIIQQIDWIERGFDDIEHRISNMDKEHVRYVRATVTRLNYLLNEEDNMKGLVIQLLNKLSGEENLEASLRKVGEKMNLSQLDLLSERSLYRKRKGKKDFKEDLEPDEEMEELSKDEILKLNKIKNRYSKQEIETFIEEQMVNGTMEVSSDTIASDEAFDKLVLAYDYSIRKESPYQVQDEDVSMIDNGRYEFPGLVFVKKSSRTQGDRND